MDYGAMQGMVLSLLQSNGQRMTLRHVTSGTYTDGAATLVRTDETVYGVQVNNSDYAIATGLVSATDTRLLISASDTVPQETDEIVNAAGHTFVISRVTAINPAGTPLAYDLQVRG